MAMLNNQRVTPIEPPLSQRAAARLRRSQEVLTEARAHLSGSSSVMERWTCRGKHRKTIGKP